MTKRIVCMLLMVASAGAAGAGEASDWPAFGGPSGDFRSPETGIRTDWSDGKLPVLWSVELAEGYAGPAVVGDACYVFDRVGGSARLRALDAADGRERWRFTYATAYEDMYGFNGGPRCMPVVDADRVYILGPEGMLHCVSATDGAIKWKLDTVAKWNVQQNFFGVGSTPIIEGDLLIMQVGGSPAGSLNVRSGRTRGNGSGIVALDKLTGDVRYAVTDELASYASPVVRTIDGRRWGFAFARGGLVGFDPASGAVRFHHPWRATITESVNVADPVVVGDRVFITECYGPGACLLKIEGDAAKVIWQDERGPRGKSLASHWATPVHHEGYLYGASGRHEEDAELRCVELATGKIVWRAEGFGRASMIFVDGYLIVLDERGELSLVRATPEAMQRVTRLRPTGADGRPLLKYPTWAAPVLSRGRLYVRGDDRLLCMRLIEAEATNPPTETP